MFELMIFMFCFLFASIIMFFYFLKRSDSHYRSLSDENAQLRVLLRAMESRLENLEKNTGYFSGETSAGANHLDGETKNFSNEREDSGISGHDPLLHLSFEEPACRESGSLDNGIDLLPDPAEERRS